MTNEKTSRRSFLSSMVGLGVASNLDDKILSEEVKIEEDKTPTQKSYQWRSHIQAYFDEELRTIKFPSRENRDLTVNLCFEDPNLRGVPWVSYDGRNIVLPEEAIQYLKEGGVKLRVHKLTISQ